MNSCGDEKPIEYNRTVPLSSDGVHNGTSTTLTLWPTHAYSDNNHLARLSWYKDAIASLIKLNRAPEDPLQVKANNGCWGKGPASEQLKGLYMYHEMNIGH